MVSIELWPLIWAVIVVVTIVLSREYHSRRAFWQDDRATEFALRWRDVYVDSTC
jgi:hypothetical protein